MATNTIKARHVVAEKTAEQWSTYTVIPLKGEICVESDTNKMKIGNGTDVYKDLPYFGTSVLADNTWISSSVSNGETTISHIGPSTEDSSKSKAVSGANVITGISVDAKGHVRTAPSTKTVTAGSKISITNDTSKITVTHESTTRSNTNDTQRVFEGNVITGVTTDATGHVTGVETSKLPANPVSAASGTTGQLMQSDGDNTTSASSFKASNGTFSASSTDTLYTGKSIADYIGNTISPLSFKGTIGTGGTVTTLPATHTKGDTYVVKTAGTYAGQKCEVGDMIICVNSGTTAADADWNVLNGENQVTNKAATMTTDASAVTTLATVDGTDITAKVTHHTPTGASAGTAGTSSATSGTSIAIPYLTTDAKGHVTAKGTHTHTVTVGDKALKVGSNSGDATTVITMNENSNDKTLAVVGDDTWVKGVVSSETDKVIVTLSHDGPSTGSDITTANGTPSAASAGTSYDVLTGVTVTADAKGHITGVKTTRQKVVSNKNTSTLTNGSTKVEVDSGTGVTLTGGTQKFTVGTGTTTFDVSVAHGNHTGDVTSTGLTTTIANNAVTNVKLADMAAGTIKGNNGTASGDPKDLTVAQVKAMLNVIESSVHHGGSTAASSGTGLAGVKLNNGKVYKISTFALEDDKGSGNTLIIDGNF